MRQPWINKVFFFFFFFLSTNKNLCKPREGNYPLKCKQKNRKPARLQDTAPFNLTIVITFDSAFR